MFGDVPATLDQTWEEAGQAQAAQQGSSSAGAAVPTSAGTSIRLAWLIIIVSLALLWGYGFTFRKGSGNA
jgi:hypothetical protein